jgi:exonuclease SbcD
VDYAIKESADLVVFCGDAYKSRDPSQTQQREFARRIKRLSACGIPVFLLVGNHDLPGSMGRATTTEIFDTLAVDNVYVASKPCITRVSTRSGPVQIVSLPWLKRGNVIAREEVKNMELAEVNQKMREILTGIIENLAKKLDPAVPAILAGHVWVVGAKLGSEEGMTVGQEHTLLLSAVARPEFDYVALGHIHRQQVLNTEPPVVYAGSLERVDFGDESLDKGFYVVDIAAKGTKRETKYRLESVSGRKFMTLEKTLFADDPDSTGTVVKLLEREAESIKRNIVRLELTLPQSLQSQLCDIDIRNAAEGAYYLAITKKIERVSRVRLADVYVERITPLQAMETYLITKHKDSPSHLQELLEAGRHLIQDETTPAK